MAGLFRENAYKLTGPKNPYRRSNKNDQYVTEAYIMSAIKSGICGECKLPILMGAKITWNPHTHNAYHYPYSSCPKNA